MGMEQFGTETARNGRQALVRKNSQRPHQTPITVLLAQQPPDMRGHFQPQTVQLLRFHTRLPGQCRDMFRQAV